MTCMFADEQKLLIDLNIRRLMELSRKSKGRDSQSNYLFSDYRTSYSQSNYIF